MTELSSVNPYNGETLKTFKVHQQKEIDRRIESSQTAFKDWAKTSFEDRATLLKHVSKNLQLNCERLASNISIEMGKPIQESMAEVEKCRWVCDFYAEHAPGFLEKEMISTDAKGSWVQYQPLGPILAIMPWNYPLWQVFRFAAPAIMAGNTCLLKHASNVTLCALNIETLFNEAKALEGLFQTLLVGVEQIPSIIEHPATKAVTLTGSEKAGSSVASIAGKNIKKTVLELGGSNAFVLLEDADLDLMVPEAVKARYQNTGQSCIAAKRFLVHRDIEKEFMERFVEQVRSLKAGDPLTEETEIGPMAKEDLATLLEDQVKKSIDKGATLVTGGNRTNAHFEPCVLSDVAPGMPAFDQELFGPVAAVTIFDDDEKALDLINKSQFGLGATICTTDPDRSTKFIDRVEDGAVFVNAMVKSDPRLPFGGTKRSGYGRELSRQGIREFVNIKTVYIR